MAIFLDFHENGHSLQSPWDWIGVWKLIVGKVRNKPVYGPVYVPLFDISEKTVNFALFATFRSEPTKTREFSHFPRN